MFGDSWGCNSVFPSKLLKNNIVYKVPGDVRQCFRIRTHSKLHVSMKCDHAKKLSLTCDLLAGGNLTHLAHIWIKQNIVRQWLCVLPNSPSSSPSLWEREVTVLCCFLLYFKSLPQYWHVCFCDTVVGWLWIWVSRCCLSLILYLKVYVPVVSMATFCLFVQQIFFS